MSKKIKVRYSFSVIDHFSGELEMTQDEFEQMDSLPDTKLTEKLMDMVDLSDPIDWSGQDCDTFEQVD